MHLQAYLDINQSADVPTFRRKLVTFADELGFGLINAAVVVDVPGTNARISSVGNPPAGYELIDTYETSALNPVTKRLKRTSVPFAYDQEFYVSEGAASLWEAQAPYGYANGIAVAMHMPDHRHFLLGVDRSQKLPCDGGELTQLFASLQLLAVHAQEAALRLIGDVKEAMPAPELSKRELEILKWTMDGKSAWSVGEILGISENTVNFHLRKTLRKLHSSSKHQAVLKAIALRLL